MPIGGIRSVRTPVVAGSFYPADETSCRRQVAECVREGSAGATGGPILGGVVPHAGWVFSGTTAGRVFGALQGQEIETFVLTGAVHSWGVDRASLYGSGSWRTPLGDLEIDEALAQEVLRLSPNLIANRPQAHAGEHSIEVQTPFIKFLFPEACILPVAVPPSVDAGAVGRILGLGILQMARRAVVLGSSDLTHYGPRYGFAPAGVGERGLQWARSNDERILDLMVRMCGDEIIPEAEAHANACGAGAIAAAIAGAAELGAGKGLLLQHTTSHEVMPMGRPSDLVGYGAVIFVKR